MMVLVIGDDDEDDDDGNNDNDDPQCKEPFKSPLPHFCQSMIRPWSSWPVSLLFMKILWQMKLNNAVLFCWNKFPLEITNKGLQGNMQGFKNGIKINNGFTKDLSIFLFVVPS